jgi:beta-xylosidase
MVDENGTDAYIAYNGWFNSHTISIEKLNDTFTDSLGANFNSGLISPPSNEAPILFYRKGWYYLLYGHTCCFCKEGAGAAV